MAYDDKSQNPKSQDINVSDLFRKLLFWGINPDSKVLGRLLALLGFVAVLIAFLATLANLTFIPIEVFYL